jgi:hypothetical protein
MPCEPPSPPSHVPPVPRPPPSHVVPRPRPHPRRNLVRRPLLYLRGENDDSCLPYVAPLRYAIPLSVLRLSLSHSLATHPPTHRLAAWLPERQLGFGRRSPAARRTPLSRTWDSAPQTPLRLYSPLAAHHVSATHPRGCT